jgi:hypothetical protein
LVVFCFGFGGEGREEERALREGGREERRDVRAATLISPSLMIASKG